MKLHIKEFAGLTGVSVRTLHYYDEIGLLEPSSVDEQNGYRSYDERSLERMKEIIFYRELDFPLKVIAEILNSPQYDRRYALMRQKELLLLKRNRLDDLIAAIDESIKGDNSMEEKIMKKTEYERSREEFAAEARERWGNTAAYRDYTERNKGCDEKDMKDKNHGLDEIFERFTACLESGEKPSGDRAKALTIELQRYITANFYECTDELLMGLGELYSSDERFREHIDKSGKGTAEFVSSAIKSRLG